MTNTNRTEGDHDLWSDAELIAMVRSGDGEAYGILWLRHSSAAIRLARGLTTRVDPEDVAAEAFARTLEALSRGKGPEVAFRPYLLAVVRNTAAMWGRGAARSVGIGELDFEDPQFGGAAIEAALDRLTVVAAFASLSPRWQEVLWYAEVEQLSPVEIGALMGGMTPTAVSALAYRAREGLRLAWIRAHLRALSADDECLWAVERIPGLQRGSLGDADTGRLALHVRDCRFCALVLEEAEEATVRLSGGRATAPGLRAIRC